jgi:serine/threonine protein kinase
MEIAAPVQLPPPHVYRASMQMRSVLDADNRIREKQCLISESGRYYEIGRFIRESQFGHVNHALALVQAQAGDILVRIDPPAHVALKVYNRTKLHELQGKTQENPVKEMATMEYIRQHGGHVNVIQLIECCADEERVYAIMEFCDGGDLYELVESAGALPEGLARYYFRQVVLGLRYLHSLPLAHRDLSLENVLFSGNGGCKIIDLGMCLRLPRNEATGQVVPIPAQGPCGKKNYMAPEILVNAHPFEPLLVDIWALGVMLFILVTGVPPMDFANKLDARYVMITSGRMPYLLEQWGITLSPILVDLLMRMLRAHPPQRILPDQILSHPWMQLPDIPPAAGDATNAMPLG